MKKKDKLSIVLLLLISGSVALGSNFSYKRALSGGKSGWYEIVLPNTIYGKTTRGLTDLRVIGNGNKKDTLEAPYLLQSTEGKSEMITANFRLLNQSHNADGYFYTFENQSGKVVNELAPQFRELNFDREVVLRGSHDQKSWFTLVDKRRIISIKDEKTTFNNCTLHFSGSDYRYLRLEIKGEEDPRLTCATLQLTREKAGEYFNINPKSENHIVDKERKESIISLELNALTPVCRIRLNVSEKIDFYRPITVEYASDSIVSGDNTNYIYSTLYSGILSSSEIPEIRFQGKVLKKIRITISNNDNPPLHFQKSRITGYFYKLTCRLAEPANYFLMYGDASLTAPQYDIVRFQDKIPASLGKLNVGEEIKVTDLSSSHGLFENTVWLWVVLVAIIALLATFTLKMMKEKEDQT